MKNYSLLLFFIFLVSSCRPQLETLVTNPTVFDYNFNGFITQKNDTIKSSTWTTYELYLKPKSTLILNNDNRFISFKPTNDKDLKVFYQLYNLNNEAISADLRTGDISRISVEHLIDHKVFCKIKVVPPNDIGRFALSINATWNGLNKAIVKTVVVVP
jgi:hypothetical protein